MREAEERSERLKRCRKKGEEMLVYSVFSPVLNAECSGREQGGDVGPVGTYDQV